jgi:hypothetical protein
MRWRLWGASVYFCLAAGAVPAWAQSPPATLEERGPWKNAGGAALPSWRHTET